MAGWQAADGMRAGGSDAVTGGGWDAVTSSGSVVVAGGGLPVFIGNSVKLLPIGNLNACFTCCLRRSSSLPYSLSH